MRLKERERLYPICQAAASGLSRIAKIEDFYFSQLQVVQLMQKYGRVINSRWVYGGGIVKSFIQMEQQEIRKLFVEPVLQGQAI